jgi:ParB family chromosome partitioning protein
MSKPYAAMTPGLAELFSSPSKDEPIQTVPIKSIKPFQFQSRRTFDDETIKELAENIRSLGVLQPLVVRPTSFSGVYELIAGERRLRAAALAELTEVPVIIRELSDLEAREVHLAENLLRENLNAVDEVEGILEFLSLQVNSTVDEVTSLLYQMHNSLHGKVTHNVVCNPQSQAIEAAFKRLGIKWNSFVSHRLSVLKLPPEVLAAVRNGLEYTKAQAIARVKDENARAALLENTIADGLTLSQIKEQVSELNPTEQKPETPATKLSDTVNQLRKAKVWEDPKKKRRFQKLMDDMQKLLEE